MTDRTPRWFQLSLKSLFLLTLLVATFFAGYTLATKRAEEEIRRATLEAQRAAEEKRQEAEGKEEHMRYTQSVARAYAAWMDQKQAAKAQPGQ